MLPKHTLDIARDAGASQADSADNEVQPLLGLVGDINRLAVADARGLEVRLSKCGQILLVALGLSRSRSGWSGRYNFRLWLIRLRSRMNDFLRRLIRGRRLRRASFQLELYRRIEKGRLFYCATFDAIVAQFL